MYYLHTLEAFPYVSVNPKVYMKFGKNSKILLLFNYLKWDSTNSSWWLILCHGSKRRVSSNLIFFKIKREKINKERNVSVAWTQVCLRTLRECHDDDRIDEKEYDQVRCHHLVNHSYKFTKFGETSERK